MADSESAYHHGNLRIALLSAAERRLGEAGVDGLSLRELARDVGVSHAAPRRHFPDKQALLDALAISGLHRLGAELEEALDAVRRAGFAKQMTVFASAYVDFAVRNPELLELMFLRKSAQGSEEMREAERRAFAAATTMVERARKNGDIVADDTDRTNMAILATLQGLATIMLGNLAADRDRDDLVSGTIFTLVDGLRPRV